jgi:hypothetical protein
MAQAVSRRPLTAEARVRSQVNPCGIYGGQSGTGTGFSPSTLVFPCQFYSTGAPLLGKGKKIIIIVIFIIGLHKKPQGCGASVASAAGPFTTTKKLRDEIPGFDPLAKSGTHEFVNVVRWLPAPEIEPQSYSRKGSVY